MLNNQQQETPWFQSAVFYELNIRAFCDSNGDGHGDFQGAISKLDYIKSLGVDCIWILPHYPSPLRDDGYDIADYYGIHPDYGTLNDFKAFITAAHDHDLKVVIDLVMNHTSDQHPWFQAARTDQQSPFRDYYVWSDSGTEYADTRIIFLDYEQSNWSYDELAGQYYWHRFFYHQPDLNYDNPAVQDEMFKIMRFWLDMGVDGFRADAVPYLYEREGTNCENLPETHAFLKKVRHFLNSEYPGRVFIAEANQLPQDLIPYFGNGDEFDMCFHFPIMPRLFMAVKQENKATVINILKDIPSIPAGTQWMTFLRNHDELTLEMVTPQEREWMWSQYAPDPAMRSNLGIRRRLAPLLENHKGKWLALNAILMSMLGAPVIYYGDEIGMGDNIELPDRHGCRTPMQWDESPHAGFSTAKKTYSPVNSDLEFGFQAVNVAQQETDPKSFLNAMRFLTKVRKTHPELQHGELEILDTASRAVLGYWRRLGRENTLCLYNLSSEVQSVYLYFPEMQGEGELIDLLHTNRSWSLRDYLPPVLKMRPCASHWLYWKRS